MFDIPVDAIARVRRAMLASPSLLCDPVPSLFPPPTCVVLWHNKVDPWIIAVQASLSTYLGVGHTTVVPRLGERLVLAVAVAAGRSSSHLEYCSVGKVDAVVSVWVVRWKGRKGSRQRVRIVGIRGQLPVAAAGAKDADRCCAVYVDAGGNGAEQVDWRQNTYLS